MDNNSSTPTLWQLLHIWNSIGLQSFGGGATTILLIQQAFIDKGKWMTQEEFQHTWNLCLFSPGINILALATLIGHRFGGFPGIICSLLGLLLPSATITCLITAGFALIKQLTVVQNVLDGIIPASATIMLIVALRVAQPQFKQARQEGIARIIISTAFIAIGFIALTIFHLPVPIVLPCAAIAGAIIFSHWSKNERLESEQQS